MKTKNETTTATTENEVIDNMPTQCATVKLRENRDNHLSEILNVIDLMDNMDIYEKQALVEFLKVSGSVIIKAANKLRK